MTLDDFELRRIAEYLADLGGNSSLMNEDRQSCYPCTESTFQHYIPCVDLP